MDANLLVCIIFAEKRMKMCIAPLDQPPSNKVSIALISIQTSLFPSLIFVEEGMAAQTFVLVRTKFYLD